MMQDNAIGAVCPEVPFPDDDDYREYPAFDEPIEAYDRGRL